MLIDILRNYLLLFSAPRYRSRSDIPDGSPLLDCLAYGLRKLVEEVAQGEEIRLDERQVRALHEFDARVSQVAVSSKSWSSTQEWEGTRHSAWALIEALGWDRETKADA